VFFLGGEARRPENGPRIEQLNTTLAVSNSVGQGMPASSSNKPLEILSPKHFEPAVNKLSSATVAILLLNQGIFLGTPTYIKVPFLFVQLLRR
jgi:hypothetical protein